MMILCCVLCFLAWTSQLACVTSPPDELQKEQTPTDANRELLPEKPVTKEEVPEPAPLRWATSSFHKKLLTGVTHTIVLPTLEGGTEKTTLTLNKAPVSVVLKEGKLVVRLSYNSKTPISLEVIASSGVEKEVLSVTLTPLPPVWTKLPQKDGPSSRANQSMALAGKRLLVFGGFLQGTTGSNDLWSFDRKTKAWKEIKTTGELPPKGGVFRWVVTKVEEDGKKVEGLIVQAMIGTSTPHNDSYRFVIEEHNATFVKLKVEGTLPLGFAGLVLGAVGYDAQKKSVMLFGGLNAYGNQLSNKLYVGTVNKNSIKWVDKTPRLSPPPRFGSQFGVDPVSGRLFVASGSGASGPLADIWVLYMRDANGPRWVELKPEGGFVGRRNGALLVDVLHNRIFIWGGGGSDFPPLSVSVLCLNDKKLKWEVSSVPTELSIRTSIYGVSDPVTGESFLGFGRNPRFLRDLWSFQPVPVTK
jgi:hypothetical protein